MKPFANLRRPAIPAALALFFVFSEPSLTQADPTQDNSIVPTGLVATVNGMAITREDLLHRIELLQVMFPATRQSTQEELARRARKEIAEEILFAEKAGLLGVTLDEWQVREYWTRLAGEAPDFAAEAKRLGTTEKQQINLARRTALAKLYVVHRAGLSSELADRIPPDPLLQRLVAITPRQIKEEFKNNSERYSKPSQMECTLVICPDEEIAQRAASALANDTPLPPEVHVERAIFLDPELEQQFPPNLIEILRESKIGTVTSVQSLEAGALVLRIDGRRAEQEANFSDAQHEIRTGLELQRLAVARSTLVRTLIHRAVFEPSDLFEL